jgi:hypothetical protein
MSEPDFVVPPEMPEGWTPPPPDAWKKNFPIPFAEQSITQVFEMCYSHSHVRAQDGSAVEELVNKLRAIWEQYESNAITKEQASLQIKDWYSVEVVLSEAPHPATKSLFADALTRILDELEK